MDVEAVEPAPSQPSSVAERLHPLAELLLGSPLPIRLDCWDGSTLGPDDAPASLRIEQNAIRRMLWAPGELGVARAYVEGDLDSNDDIVEGLRVLSQITPPDGSKRHALTEAFGAARQLRVLGPPPAVPEIEYRPTPRWRAQVQRRWRSHSPRRDAAAISHHYDVSNDFYSLILGPSMTYSCARFAEPGVDLEQAQASKHEHICRKLGLHDAPESRLLDVGCGWGSMAIHAATQHGTRVVGITISEEQAELARRRVAEAGVASQVEIRLQDYRDLRGETFDAISSIGMFEHVGKDRIGRYFETVRNVLRPRGRFLNHAISSVGSSKLSPDTFIYRYVFPDGELIDVADTVHAMQQAGLEVRDVESLREHYAMTLRAWLANLDAKWPEVVAEAGVARARAWKLYMAGATVGFDDGGNNIHQVLGVLPDADGVSGMPATRPA